MRNILHIEMVKRTEPSKILEHHFLVSLPRKIVTNVGKIPQSELSNTKYQIPCLIISGTLIIKNNIFKYRKPCRSRDRQNQCPFFDSIYNFGNKGIRDDDTITGYICS